MYSSPVKLILQWTEEHRCVTFPTMRFELLRLATLQCGTVAILPQSPLVLHV